MAAIRRRSPRRRNAILSTVIAAALIAMLAVTFAILRPTPPRSVTMATGPEGSAYAALGERYREALAKSRIELVLRPTAGALENVALLDEPSSGVDIAFISAGTTSAEASPGIRSLGTVFIEAFWVFYRVSAYDGNLESLRGSDWSAGTQGSRERASTLRLLELLGLGRDFPARLLEYSPAEAERALLDGDIDVATIVSTPESPIVRRLLASPEIGLMSFERADAYVSLYPFLSKLIIPRGVGSLALDLPPVDVTLLGAEVSLGVRESLHPAIQSLLLDAAAQIHSGPGMLYRPGRYPAPDAVDVPISDSAVQYYKSGRPFLQRYLPFWLAVFVAQLLVASIPIIGVLYPALRLMPAAYGWAMRRRVFRLYGELKYLETQIDEAGSGGASVESLTAQLDDLEKHISRLRLPSTFASLVYTLRMHVSLVRSRLAQQSSRTQS